MAPRPLPVRWLRAHPQVADGLLAGLLWVLGLVGLLFPYHAEGQQPVEVLALGLLLLETVPLVWRRREPVAVLAAVTTGVFVSEAIGYPGTAASLGLLVAIYSVTAHTGPPRAVRAAVGFMVALSVWLLLGWLTDHPGLGLDDVISNYVVALAVFLLGDIMRRRREHVLALEERASRLERERQLEAERAVQRERARIAREVHDVVAHAVTVMVVQAGAARRVADAEPERAVEALGAIEQTGRGALDELRRLLGVLRRDDHAGGEPVDLTPQPSLAEVPELVAADPTAGVELVVEGDPRSLPPGIEVSAYRIVQEALTNVRKHAGPARAVVTLRYGADALEVEVADDGRGASAQRDGRGHGLTGMRERAGLCGGEVRAGPRRGGGWQVSARLPYPRDRVGAA